MALDLLGREIETRAWTVLQSNGPQLGGVGPNPSRRATQNARNTRLASANQSETALLQPVKVEGDPPRKLIRVHPPARLHSCLGRASTATDGRRAAARIRRFRVWRRESTDMRKALTVTSASSFDSWGARGRSGLIAHLPGMGMSAIESTAAPAGPPLEVPKPRSAGFS